MATTASTLASAITEVRIELDSCTMGGAIIVRAARRVDV
jgi:hypothetical protein